MLYTAFTIDGPTAVRYPRGSGPGVAVEKQMSALPVGRAETRRSGRRIAILAFGSMVGIALRVGDSLDATVVNMRFIKPIDAALIVDLASRHHFLVTVEENTTQGGAGAAVAEVLSQRGIQVPLLLIGLPDRFVDHGDPGLLLKHCGLDADGIAQSIRSRFGMTINVAHGLRKSAV